MDTQVRESRARCLMQLARLHVSSGDWSTAAECALLADELLGRSTGDDSLIADGLEVRAEIALSLGQFNEARTALEQALRCRRAATTPESWQASRALMFTLHRFGLLSLSTDDTQRAEELLTEAELIASRLAPHLQGRIPAEPGIHGALANLYFLRGDYLEAVQSSRRSITGYSQYATSGSVRIPLAALARAKHNHASICLESGFFEEAYTYARSAVQEWEHIRDERPPAAAAEIAIALNTLGSVEFRRGNLVSSFRHFERGLRILDDSGSIASRSVSRRYERILMQNMATQLRMAGEFERALALYDDAIQSAHADYAQLDNGHHELVRLNLNRGQCLLAFGRVMDAQLSFQAALSMSEALIGEGNGADTRLRDDCLKALADAATASGDFQRAESLYLALIERCNQQNAERGIATENRKGALWQQLGELYITQGALPSAKHAMAESIRCLEHGGDPLLIRPGIHLRPATLRGMGYLLGCEGRWEEAQAAIADAFTLEDRLASEFAQGALFGDNYFSPLTTIRIPH